MSPSNESIPRSSVNGEKHQKHKTNPFLAAALKGEKISETHNERTEGGEISTPKKGQAKPAQGSELVRSVAAARVQAQGSSVQLREVRLYRERRCGVGGGGP
jgi:hypothetical protein